MPGDEEDLPAAEPAVRKTDATVLGEMRAQFHASWPAARDSAQANIVKFNGSEFGGIMRRGYPAAGTLVHFVDRQKTLPEGEGSKDGDVEFDAITKCAYLVQACIVALLVPMYFPFARLAGTALGFSACPHVILAPCTCRTALEFGG